MANDFCCCCENWAFYKVREFCVLGIRKINEKIVKKIFYFTQKHLKINLKWKEKLEKYPLEFFSITRLDVIP